jgi:2-polyprenyl-3-methyl-5-hydroxy-6-metoxy-1,4-benzoquinol methylase
MRVIAEDGRIILDRSRQWPRAYGDVANHHLYRYEFAAVNASGRILDAACGSGYGSQILGLGDRDVTGVDISSEAIEWAMKNFPGPKYIQGRIEDSPWEGEFDTIVSLETIEHIKDPSAALKAFRRACVGHLFVSVPNENNYPFKAENFIYDDSPHFRHYRPEEFDELLESNGFKVLDRFCQVHKLQPEIVPGTNGLFMTYICS